MEIIGHRGARGRFPENTLEGFRAAIASGVTRFELDAGMSADGFVVVHHDVALNPDLARDADGAWITPPAPLLRTLDVRAIRGFDIGRLRPGSPTARSFPEQRPEDGARIPLLAEVLALPAHVTIEVKSLADRPDATPPPDEMAERVADVVAEAGAADRVIVSSFDWRVLRAMRRLRPDLPLACLTSARSVAASAIWWGGATPRDGSVARAVLAEGAAIWSPEHPDLAQDDVAAAHALGLRVVPWTVNRPEDMRRLAGWGVDGMITDYPDRWEPGAA